MKQKIDKRKAAGEATKERLIDAAQRLFAAHGIDGTTVREIAAAAGTDLSMTNYHFGSKEGLYRAVISRRADSINAQRLLELARALDAADGRPELSAIVEAFVKPWLQLRNNPHFDGVSFARVLVREIVDPRERQRGLIEASYDAMARRFIAAFGEALPGTTHADCCWAYHFTLGTLIYTLASTGRLEKLSNNSCQAADIEAVLAHIVPYITDGVRACVGVRSATSPARRQPPRPQAATPSSSAPRGKQRAQTSRGKTKRTTR